MLWIPSFCKKVFVSPNTYTYQYIYCNSSSTKNSSIIQNKKEYTIINNIVYDNDGNFGQFVIIDLE